MSTAAGRRLLGSGARVCRGRTVERRPLGDPAHPPSCAGHVGPVHRRVVRCCARMYRRRLLHRHPGHPAFGRGVGRHEVAYSGGAAAARNLWLFWWDAGRGVPQLATRVHGDRGQLRRGQPDAGCAVERQGLARSAHPVPGELRYQPTGTRTERRIVRLRHGLHRQRRVRSRRPSGLFPRSLERPSLAAARGPTRLVSRRALLACHVSRPGAALSAPGRPAPSSWPPWPWPTDLRKRPRPWAHVPPDKMTRPALTKGRRS